MIITGFSRQTWIFLVDILLILCGKNCGITFRIPSDTNLVARHPEPFPQNEVRQNTREFVICTSFRVSWVRCVRSLKSLSKKILCERTCVYPVWQKKKQPAWPSTPGSHLLPNFWWQIVGSVQCLLHCTFWPSQISEALCLSYARSKKRSFFHILLLQKILKDAKNILPHCRCHTKTNPPCVLQLQ